MTCESVMTVLRNNKDSLMAVLEAFVYDPLLNWRLMETIPGARRPVLSPTTTVKYNQPISVPSVKCYLVTSKMNSGDLG